MKDYSRTERPSTSRTEVNIKRVRPVSVDSSNDLKSAEKEKGQCLEDYH